MRSHRVRPTTPPDSPHPGRSCDHTCDVTDAAHGYGGVFTVDLNTGHAHPAFEADNCPACGTSARLDDHPL
jgi:hypothetical protein